jgi:hypothetical protein
MRSEAKRQFVWKDHRSSNDEAERRGDAQTHNEADLSQSSTPSFGSPKARSRNRSNRLLGATRIEERRCSGTLVGNALLWTAKVPLTNKHGIAAKPHGLIADTRLRVKRTTVRRAFDVPDDFALCYICGVFRQTHLIGSRSQRNRSAAGVQCAEYGDHRNKQNGFQVCLHLETQELENRALRIACA